jgi:hypothetical protein
MLWKTMAGRSAPGGDKSRNCETWRSLKFPAAANSSANLSILRLKISNSAQNAQKFLLAQGTEQRFQGIPRQSFEPIRVTGRFETSGVSLAAKQQGISHLTVQ